MMTQETLLDLIKNLPPVHLEIIDLVWKLVDEDGKLDEQKLSFYYTEVEKAAAQARSYAKETGELVRCLNHLLR